LAIDGGNQSLDPPLDTSEDHILGAPAR
jgi:hypothetical protein